MPSIKINIALLLLSTILGCSHQQLSTTKINVNKHKSRSVTLLNYELSSSSLQFSTLGYGCTFYNNYQIVADKSDNSIEVIEVVADNCQMKPRSVALSYSIQHLDLNFEKPLMVKNFVDRAVTSNLVVL